MRNQHPPALFAAGAVLVALLALVAGCQTAVAPPSEDAGYMVPKTPDGAPDFNGIWQALGSAHWDLEDHAARAGPAPLMGALGAIPAGRSVVEGGTIPYQEWALEQRAENRVDWVKKDPAVKCYMPGVPRATYMPFPFQFVQTPTAIMVAYEFTSSTRVIHLDRPGTEAELPAWMGYSLGRFEGDALVVDVTSQVPDTWFDAAGNFHSDALKVTERFTRTGPDTLRYEATIDDPAVFTRPWKITMPLYRRLEAGAQILEFKCIEFAEYATYGHLYPEAQSPEATPAPDAQGPDAQGPDAQGPDAQGPDAQQE